MSNPPALPNKRQPLIPQLPDRAALINQIDALLQDHQRVPAFSVCLIDIDQVHSLDQSIGPAAATELLTRIGARLQHGIRSFDTVAGIGRSTFAILLLMDDNETLLRETMQRLLLAIDTPVNIPGSAISTTASIGIARYPRDADQAGALLSRAEEAMAVAKSQGGDTFCFYTPSSGELAREWGALSVALREAMGRDELTLHYQPKVDLRSSQIVGFEALLRWQHPVLGLLAPDRFLPLAEEIGLITDFNRWVIRRVLRQLRTDQNAGRPAITIGLNLSLRHFRFSDLPRFIATELTASGIAPSLLEVEISESAAMRDPEHAVFVIDRIKALGVRLSLDEFGTGLSSLSYLSRLNVDKIKIDQTLIRDITSNPANASVVAAIIALAHALGKRVIAVGVETEGQALQLRRHDCDEIQGFYFSRPGAPSDIETLFRTDRKLDLKPDGEAADQRTLLLVDDEPSILNALKRLLRPEGYTILTAESGQAALDILATNRVQVIVSDQRMPGMTGIELLSRVRELYPDTKRIILSGYSDVTTLSAAINQGAVWKFICKPWDDETLSAEISHAFSLMA